MTVRPQWLVPHWSLDSRGGCWSRRWLSTVAVQRRGTVLSGVRAIDRGGGWLNRGLRSQGIEWNVIARLGCSSHGGRAHGLSRYISTHGIDTHGVVIHRTQCPVWICSGCCTRGHSSIDWGERRHRIPRVSCRIWNSRRKCSRGIAHFRGCCDSDTGRHRPPKRIRCRAVGAVRSIGGRIGRHISTVPMRGFCHVTVTCPWRRTSCSGGRGGNPWLVHGRP